MLLFKAQGGDRILADGAVAGVDGAEQSADDPDGFLPSNAQLQLRDSGLNLLDLEADNASGNYSVSDSVTPGRYYIRAVTTTGLPPGHGNYTLTVNFS